MRYLRKAVMAALCCVSFCAAASDAGKPVYFGSSANAPFSKAVKVGDILYLSGMIGADEDGNLAKDFSTQITQLMENLLTTLTSFNLTNDAVFKCTVMIDDMEHWPEFNRIYTQYFTPGRLPARSAFGANGLAMGAAAELECMAYMPGESQ